MEHKDIPSFIPVLERFRERLAATEQAGGVKAGIVRRYIAG